MTEPVVACITGSSIGTDLAVIKAGSAGTVIVEKSVVAGDWSHWGGSNGCNLSAAAIISEFETVGAGETVPLSVGRAGEAGVMTATAALKSTIPTVIAGAGSHSRVIGTVRVTKLTLTCDEEETIGALTVRAIPQGIARTRDRGNTRVISCYTETFCTTDASGIIRALKAVLRAGSTVVALDVETLGT